MVALESACYYLVTIDRDEEAVLIFLGTDESSDTDDGPEPELVTLELLPPGQRFGYSGGVAMGRPPLGRWPSSMDRFRQFLTYTEMIEAGWIHVPKYRICDSWEDYFTPWSPPSEDQPTLNALDEMDADDTAASEAL